MSRIVYGITPNTENGKFEITEAEISELDYMRLKPLNAIFDTRKACEKKYKEWIKQYNKRK